MKRPPFVHPIVPRIELPFVESDERFHDRHGLAFDDVAGRLPKRAGDFRGRDAVKDPELLRYLHVEMSWCSNPWCDCPDAYWAVLELHHVIGGRGSRSDERTNTLPLCKWCHQGPRPIVDDLGFVLFLKWIQAGEEVDWIRLAILHGRFLPPLVIPWPKLKRALL